MDTVKYKIDTFQREYKWGKSQIELLLEDLESKCTVHMKQYKIILPGDLLTKMLQMAC